MTSPKSISAQVQRVWKDWAALYFCLFQVGSQIVSMDKGCLDCKQSFSRCRYQIWVAFKSRCGQTVKKNGYRQQIRIEHQDLRYESSLRREILIWMRRPECTQIKTQMICRREKTRIETALLLTVLCKIHESTTKSKAWPLTGASEGTREQNKTSAEQTAASNTF